MRPDRGAPAAPGPREDEDATFWLVTFSDLVLLLLAFGIVAVALRSRTPGPEPPAAVTESAAVPHAALGAPGDALDRFAAGAAPADDAAEPPRDAVPAARLAEAAAELRALVAAAGLGPEARVTVEPTAVVVAMSDAVTFPSGSAELRPEALPVLAAVRALAVAQPDLHLDVAGHTDDVPIASSEFPSNLELSLARAARVARALVAGDPAVAVRTRAAGYGEHRPLAANGDPAGRARNRRVEVRLLPVDYSMR